MEGTSSRTDQLLVERWVVRGIGTLAILGAAAFLVAGLRTIAIYLLLSGVAFWLSGLNGRQRYENVLDAPPEGFRPTGEVYDNPGGSGPVAVYFKGISRVYVRQE